MQPGGFIKMQPVATGKNGVEFQPITIEKPENELENLWTTTTTKINNDVYQSLVKAIKKRKRILFTFLIFKFFIGDYSLDFSGKKWVPGKEFFRTQLIQRTHDFLLTGHFCREIRAAIIFKNYFWPGIF